MQNTALALLACICGLIALLVIGRLPFQYRSEMRKARTRAEQQFRSYRVNSFDGSVLFDGKTAQILDTSYSYSAHNGSVRNHVMTVFALTPAGQLFLFKSNETGNPYFAPLSEERAKLVLKKKYREAFASDA